MRAALGIASLLLPALSADGQLAPRIADRIMSLNRATSWTQVAAIQLPFRTFHPQGMVKVGDQFFLSAVEIITAPQKLSAPVDGQAYDTGAGVGHLFKFSTDGRLIDQITLGEGAIYHPGGIDYDGTAIWVPVAQYRPNSRSIVYRVDPGTMKATRMLTVPDHIGAIVRDTQGNGLVGLSWGSRRRYVWPLDGDGRPGPSKPPVPNPTSYVDYQDCHDAGQRRMLCAGVAGYRVRPGDTAFQLGGVELVDLAADRLLWQAPIALWSPSGRAMTQNPFWMEATATGVRAWFIPDDDVSTLYVYDAAVPPDQRDR